MRIEISTHRGTVLEKMEESCEFRGFIAANLSETREALDIRSVFAMGQLLISETAWDAGGTKLERPSEIFHNFMVLTIKNTTRGYFYDLYCYL